MINTESQINELNLLKEDILRTLSQNGMTEYKDWYDFKDDNEKMFKRAFIKIAEDYQKKSLNNCTEIDRIANDFALEADALRNKLFKNDKFHELFKRAYNFVASNINKNNTGLNDSTGLNDNTGLNDFDSNEEEVYITFVHRCDGYFNKDLKDTVDISVVKKNQLEDPDWRESVRKLCRYYYDDLELEARESAGSRFS